MPAYGPGSREHDETGTSPAGSPVMLTVTAPVPTLAGTGLDLSLPAADLARRATLVPRRDLLPGRDSLEDLCRPAAAVADLDATSALTAEIVRSVVAAVTAVTFLERPLAEDRAETARLSLASTPVLPTGGQICAVVAVDIAGFTRADRDDDIRGYLHQRLYEYLEKAFNACDIPWDECFWEDRGDGALIVVPPEIPFKGLIDPLPDRLRRLIRLHNHVSAPAADMQLRVAAHIGPVEHDHHGFVGTDVNFAFRMLDARPLKDKLAKSGAELGMIVSDDVYDKLIRRCPTLAGPGDFQTVRFQTKNTRARAWTYLPGAAA